MKNNETTIMDLKCKCGMGDGQFYFRMDRIPSNGEIYKVMCNYCCRETSWYEDIQSAREAWVSTYALKKKVCPCCGQDIKEEEES
jgi:hypothetical protein